MAEPKNSYRWLIPIFVSILITATTTTYAITAGGAVSRMAQKEEAIEKQVQMIEIDRNVINTKLDDVKSTLVKIEGLLQNHLMRTP